MSILSFEDLVESSISETLSKVLGQLVWKSIAFYFEPKVLARDPEALPELLGKIFGKNHGVLEKVIADDLLTKVGVPPENRRGADFRSFIRTAKARFISTSSNLPHPGPIS